MKSLIHMTKLHFLSLEMSHICNDHFLVNTLTTNFDFSSSPLRVPHRMTLGNCSHCSFCEYSARNLIGMTPPGIVQRKLELPCFTCCTSVLPNFNPLSLLFLFIYSPSNSTLLPVNSRPFGCHFFCSHESVKV